MRHRLFFGFTSPIAHGTPCREGGKVNTKNYVPGTIAPDLTNLYYDYGHGRRTR